MIVQRPRMPDRMIQIDDSTDPRVPNRIVPTGMSLTGLGQSVAPPNCPACAPCSCSPHPLLIIGTGVGVVLLIGLIFG